MGPTTKLLGLICVCSVVLLLVVVSWVPNTRKYVTDYGAPIVYWGKRTGRSAVRTFYPLGEVGDEYAVPGPNKLIHLVWMANPLKAYTISAIDSVLRYVPHATLKLHIMTPEGANSTVLSALKRRFEFQLSRFIEHPDIDLQIVLHPDVQSELIGTPLEKYKIPQKHFGGYVDGIVNGGDEDRGGTPFGRWKNAMVHSADVMRVVILWREGGLYLDVDHILLDNIWPLVEVVPAFMLCETKLDGQDDGRCKTINGFFAATRGHPFLWDCMARVGVLIEEHTINGVWPLRAKTADEPPHVWFTAVGPDLFAKVKNAWLDEFKDVWVLSGPEVYPSALTLQEVRHRPFQKTPQNWQNTTEPIYVMPRRYFLPTSWQDLTLNKKLDPSAAASYTKAYGFHLWEMGNTSNNKIRPKFLEILTKQPDSTLRYLFNKYCLLFCDPNQLVTDLPEFSEFMTSI